MIEIYTAVYGGYDAKRPQLVPVRRLTDASHPLPQYPVSRLAAKWWRMHPELACPDADVTVWVDGNIIIRSADFPARCAAALGGHDMAIIRHPERDCIYDEAVSSLRGEKYDGQPILQQAAHYRAMGHPAHWGLAATGMLIRRTNAATLALNAAWWNEITRWTLQDQVSLSPLLRSTGIDLTWLPASVMFSQPNIPYDPTNLSVLYPESSGEPWVDFDRHRGPDVWR